MGPKAGNKRAAPDQDESKTSSKKARTEPLRRSTRRSTASQDKSKGDAKIEPSNDQQGASSTSVKERPAKTAKVSSKSPKKATGPKPASDPKTSNTERTSDEHSYWLMKAEPESRIEKGKDVKFSIDDLAAVDKEPWDGVRNPSARNNMRAMKKGEKAFFYHSNCKIPGIAGIMEIADEHSVDESAFNPEHPYYDEKSSRDNPKWSVVHVKFLKKLETLIPLKELQKHSKEGSELANMQVLRMSRLSVSRVSKEEWIYICTHLAKLDPETLEPVN